MIEIIGTGLNQWDTGRIVRITGIEASQVHFANTGDSKAVIMNLEDSQAKIPDYLLQTGKQLCVYAVANGVTIERKSFPVMKRECPEHYVYDEDQRNFIYEVIASAETATGDAIKSAEAATEAANHATEVANQAADAVAQVTQDAARAIENAGDAAETANQAAQTAVAASETANKAATNAAQTAKSLMVVGKADGTIISLSDSIEQFFVGGNIFGKTTQDGVPTPDMPAALVSVGQSGRVAVNVNGKNLLVYPYYHTSKTENGVSFIVNADGTVGISGTSTDSAAFWFTGYSFRLEKGVTYTLSIGNNLVATQSPSLWVKSKAKGNVAYLNMSTQTSKSFTPAEDIDDALIYIVAGAAGCSFSGYIEPQLEVGKQATGYEPYKSQRQTFEVASGLRGLPVAARGNYIDVDGQQWICDEIDLSRGVRVQRCFEETVVPTYHASNNRYHATLSHNANLSYSSDSGIFVMCDKLPFNSKATSGMNGIRVSTVETNLAIAYYNGQNPGALTLMYPLATPIETAMSEEEIAAFNSLHTYRGNTTVSNSGFAHMDIEYVMDAKKYIDGLVTGAILPATVE